MIETCRRCGNEARTDLKIVLYIRCQSQTGQISEIIEFECIDRCACSTRIEDRDFEAVHKPDAVGKRNYPKRRYWEGRRLMFVSMQEKLAIGGYTLERGAEGMPEGKQSGFILNGQRYSTLIQIMRVMQGG